MKTLKNYFHFVNMHHMEIFQIADPRKGLVSGFLSVNRNGISALAIMNKLKNGCHFVNMHCMEKFQIADPPKFGSLVYPMSHLCVVLYFLIFGEVFKISCWGE